MAHTEETISNNDESQWIKQNTEKIHLKLLFELHGFKNEINEQFNSLKTNLDLQQKKPLEMLTMNSSSRQITESRIFIPRNSLLTDLFQISHIQGLRNVLVAILIIFIIQVTIDDIIEDGRLNLDFNLIFESFADLHIALFIWLIMQLSTAIIVFMGFYYWTKNRYNYRKHLKRYDTIWLLLYLTYIVLFLVLPCRQIMKHQIAFASALIILLEQLRQLMKTHAFIRENIEKVLSSVESKSNEEKFLCPDFSQYLYFLFVPTLIYRDQYPRNKIIRWSFVLKMFGEFIICIFYAYYIVVRFCIPTYENLNKTKITLSMFISILFNSIMPGSFFLLLSSYGFLHCWLNAFAEMLRFADRMFYNDWWNSTSFAAYYRTSNVVVHDWLYTYVYREIYIFMGRKSRSIPTICVVLLSAIFHEYVMVFALGFFYPVIFLVFGVVGLVCLFCLPRQESVTYNILVWILLFIGVGLQSCLYFMETYARKSCPSNNTFWDKLIPRSFVCYISLPSSKHLKIDL
ncbi:unnamed protein product [Rotaria sordida]|uniref:O-acyltransferase n=1 Tax=Rotaria sordida TaxID=392033 RepID=A0A818Y3F4_9BILA|nr:unnamed protein product [Rotaria sordida]